MILLKTVFSHTFPASAITGGPSHNAKNTFDLNFTNQLVFNKVFNYIGNRGDKGGETRRTSASSNPC